MLVGHRALVWSLRMCLLLTRPRSPLSWVSAGLPAAEEAAGAQDRQATQRERCAPAVSLLGSCS